MEVRKLYAFRCEPIDIQRSQVFGDEATEISVALIVRGNQNEIVRAFGGLVPVNRINGVCCNQRKNDVR